MEFEIKQAKGKVEIHGDPDFHFWLLNAAGAAQSGIVGNTAVDQHGVELQLFPLVEADAQPGEPRSPQRTSVRSA
jgi:hypothetical protein